MKMILNPLNRDRRNVRVGSTTEVSRGHGNAFVRAIYSAVKKFAEMVFSGKSQSFNRVLLIEYPRKGIYSLAFQTSSDLGEIEERIGEDVVCVFVPTTPNPTSGLIVMLPRNDVIRLDMEVEEALKMIISLGVVVPTWRKDQLGELPLNVPQDPQK